jgi:hypothetical protein
LNLPFNRRLFVLQLIFKEYLKKTSRRAFSITI